MRSIQLFVLVGVTSLVGCGGASDSNPTDSDSKKSQEPPKATATFSLLEPIDGITIYRSRLDRIAGACATGTVVNFESAAASYRSIDCVNDRYEFTNVDFDGADGQKIFSVTQLNTDGSLNTITHSLTIDRSGPSVTYPAFQATTTRDASERQVRFSGTRVASVKAIARVSGAAAQISCDAIDWNLIEARPVDQTLNFLPHLGFNYVCARGLDVEGNLGGLAPIQTFELKTLNAISLGASPTNNASQRSITILGDLITHYRAAVIHQGNCSNVDFTSVAVRPVSDPLIFVPAEGLNIVCAMGADVHGHWEARITQSTELVLDSVPPEFGFGPQASPVPSRDNSTVTLIPHVSGDAVAMRYRRFASLICPVAFDWTTVSEQPIAQIEYSPFEGNNVICAQARDNIGNWSAVTPGGARIIDTTPPYISMNALPLGPYGCNGNDRMLPFQGICNDPSARVELFANGQSLVSVNCFGTSWSYTVDLGNIGMASVSFSARASDPAGNLSGTVSRAFGIPDAMISSAVGWQRARSDTSSRKSIQICSDINFDGAEISGLRSVEKFEGNNRHLSNFIYRATSNSSATVSLIEAYGVPTMFVRNLTISNFEAFLTNTLTGTGSFLMDRNFGEVSNLNVSGRIEGGTGTGIFGIVESNYGHMADITTNLEVFVTDGQYHSDSASIAFQNFNLLERVTAAGTIVVNGTSSSYGVAGVVSGNRSYKQGSTIYQGRILNAQSSVSVTAPDLRQVGGLVGTNLGYLAQEADGTVTSLVSTIDASSASGSVMGGYDVGGLVGNAGNHSQISNSHSTGNVSGRTGVGGLVGSLRESNILRSSARGNVTGIFMNPTQEGYGLGGLVGLAYLRLGLNNPVYTYGIVDSFATGNVSGAAYDPGGLIGAINGQGVVLRSYSLGSVVDSNGGPVRIGGLIATSTPLSGTTIYPSVANSYWNIQTSGLTTSAGGEGRTTAEMVAVPRPANTYVNFDFANVWTQNNGSYPSLR